MKKEPDLIRRKFQIFTVALLLIMTLFMAYTFYVERDPWFQVDGESSAIAMISAGKYDFDISSTKYGINIMFAVGKEQTWDTWNYLDAYRIYADPKLYAGILPYSSQIGLQGWVCYYFGKTKITNPLLFLRIGCCLLLSLIISLICYQLYLKYGLLLSFSFYLVSICSPWIRNLSGIIYWVEFTWFIPMLLGLICLNNLNKRVWLYPLFFLAILVKTACGYEYLPVIMLSSIMFLVVELIWSVKKNKKESKLLFKAIFGVGIFSLLGFALALVIHSYLRRDGNILAGIEDIYRNTALRRTVGVIGNTELPEAVYASAFDVLKMYLRNYKTGVSNNTTGRYALVLLIVFPVCILFRKIMKRQRILNRDMYLFIFSFITCILWFVLAKQHSFIHLHINYVMWYMGFIQIGTYLILKYILKICYYYNKEKVSALGAEIVNKLQEEITRD
jgi:hypothetical protein